jgi:hypothetical protein
MGITIHSDGRIILKPSVEEDGIYVPVPDNPRIKKMIMSRETFVEAYNKYIKGEEDKNND